jgi:sugar phosphate isomerase/epimerase
MAAAFPFIRGLCVNAVYPAAVTDAQMLKTVLARMAASRFYAAAEFYHEGPNAQLADIGRHCANLRLSVVYLAGYYLKRERLDIASPDEAARKQAVSACVDMLKRAQLLGAAKMLILSGPSDASRDALSVVESAVQSVQTLIAEGERLFGSHFPQITLEFFNPNGEPYLSVGTPDVALAIASRVDSRHFGITYDTSHVAQMGLDITQTMALLHPFVTHLHLANSVSRDERHPLYGDKHPLYGDKHPLFDIPQGDLTTGDIAAFLAYCEEHRLLARVDICSAEVICREAGSEDACFRQVMKQLHTIFSKLDSREVTG